MSPLVKSRVITVVVSLALLAVAWKVLVLHPVLTWSIAGAIVFANIMPQRWYGVGTAAGFGAIAAVEFIYFGNVLAGGVLAIATAMYLIPAIAALRRLRRAG